MRLDTLANTQQKFDFYFFTSLRAAFKTWAGQRDKETVSSPELYLMIRIYG